LIKVGVVGMGKMGLLHGSTLCSFDDVEFIGFADENKFVIDTFKDLKPDWVITNDFRSLIEKNDINVIFITTPISTHYDIISYCLKNNISFFVEKPAFSTLEQAKTLSDLIHLSKSKSMVGYMMRFIETFKKGKELISNKVLGKIHNFEGTMYISQLFKPGKGWRYDPKISGGGVVMHQTCHIIDLINWYFGYPAEIASTIINLYSAQVEDYAHISLKYDDKLFGWVDSTWSKYNKRMLTTKIHCEGEFGTLTVDDDNVKIFLTVDRGEFKKGWTNISKLEISKGVEIDFGAPYYSQQSRYLIDIIKNNYSSDSQQQIHDINESIKLHRVIDCIYSSNQNSSRMMKLNFDEN